MEESIRLLNYKQPDSLDLALFNIRTVIARGVFRAFPPTTLDIMLSTGDIALIKDISFRNLLTSTFSFRDDYVKKDLLDFDLQIKNSSRKMGDFLNLTCVAMRNKAPHQCITDLEGFLKEMPNELFILLRQAQIRAFHLNIASRNFQRTINHMEEIYGMQSEESPAD